MFRCFLNFAFLSYISILFISPVHAGSDNLDKLTSAFSSKNIDRILTVLNDIKSARYQGDVLPSLHSFWKGEKSPDTDIPLEMMSYDVIKINVADVLIQAHKNHLINLKVDEFRNYALKKIDSSDKQVVSEAMMVLAHIDDHRDSDKIKAIALKSNKLVFRSSVLALSMMCNSNADSALKILEASVKDKTKLKFIKDTRAKFTKMKSTGFYCR